MTYIITRTSIVQNWASRKQKPYENSRQVKFVADAGLTYSTGEAGVWPLEEWTRDKEGNYTPSRVMYTTWVTDDSIETIVRNVGQVIVYESPVHEYPFTVENYDDYRE